MPNRRDWELPHSTPTEPPADALLLINWFIEYLINGCILLLIVVYR